MKTLIVSVLTVLGAMPIAHAGFDSGNAGDALAAEFILTGRDILQRLEIAEKEGRPVYPSAGIREAIRVTDVTTFDKVVIDGQERDAGNYPAERRIELSRPRWNDYREAKETFRRLRVALHEYLWVAHVDDTGYVISEPILKKLNVPDYSANVWLDMPGTAFAVVECTGKTRNGDYITLQVNTKGAANTPDNAEVRVERGANKFGYRFRATEISQFFESDDVKENTAMIGVGAYVNREFPISLKYNGRNFVDMDLHAVIDGGGDLGKGNLMKLWKGPGFKADEQYVLHSPVCSIWSNN